VQGGVGSDDVGVALVCFVFEVIGVVVVECTGLDLVSDVGDDLGSIWVTEPGVSVFGGVEF